MKDLYTRPELITMARDHGFSVTRMRIRGDDDNPMWEMVDKSTGEQYIVSTKLSMMEVVLQAYERAAS